jgi:hypothetical protein
VLYPVELQARGTSLAHRFATGAPQTRLVLTFTSLTAARIARGHQAPIGRGRGIRTLDVQLPKLALYQAELYPVAFRHDKIHHGMRKKSKLAGPIASKPPRRRPFLPASCSHADPKRKGCRSTLRKSGAPGEIRTPDHQVRSLVLYPAELRARRSGIIKGRGYFVNPILSLVSSSPRATRGKWSLTRGCRAAILRDRE